MNSIIWTIIILIITVSGTAKWNIAQFQFLSPDSTGYKINSPMHPRKLQLPLQSLRCHIFVPRCMLVFFKWQHPFYWGFYFWVCIPWSIEGHAAPKRSPGISKVFKGKPYNFDTAILLFTKQRTYIHDRVLHATLGIWHERDNALLNYIIILVLK